MTEYKRVKPVGLECLEKLLVFVNSEIHHLNLS